MDCPECNGVGSVAVIYGDEVCAAPCPSCGGHGQVPPSETVADLRLVPDLPRDERDMDGDETTNPNEAAA